MVVPWGVHFKQPLGGCLLWFPREGYLGNHLVVVPWGGHFKRPPGGCLLSVPQSGSTIKVVFLFRDLPKRVFSYDFEFPFFRKKCMFFLVFVRFFWSRAARRSRTNPGEPNKSIKAKLLGQKIAIFILEINRLYSVIGTYQSSRLKG